MPPDVSKESEKKKAADAWAEYYAKRGLTRPPMSNLGGPAAARKPATWMPPPVPTPPPAARPSVPAQRKILSADLAAAVDAVDAELAGVTAAPFITAMHREAALIERRRELWRRVWLGSAAVAAGGVLLWLMSVFAFNREPAGEALAIYAQKTMAEVLAVMSSATLPLASDGATCVLKDRLDRTHLRYEVQVTLRLRKDLVVLAMTNGTASYRQLQESVAIAQQTDLKLGLFAEGVVPRAPELPRLLQVVRHAGEPVVVRVPFQAERFGSRWRLLPPQLGLRLLSHPLEGEPIERFAGSPHLLFGSPESLLEVRRLMKAARDYIIAVQKEAQMRAIIDGQYNGIVHD